MTHNLEVQVGVIPFPDNPNQILILNPIGTPTMHKAIKSNVRAWKWDGVYANEDTVCVYLIIEPELKTKQAKQ